MFQGSLGRGHVGARSDLLFAFSILLGMKSLKTICELLIEMEVTTRQTHRNETISHAVKTIRCIKSVEIFVSTNTLLMLTLLTSVESTWQLGIQT